MRAFPRFLRARTDPIAWWILSLLRFAFSGRGAFVTSIGILASILTILVVLSPDLQKAIGDLFSDSNRSGGLVTWGWKPALIGLVLIVLSLFLTAALQLHQSLVAKDYAYFAIGNRPVTSALLITSHHIQRVVSAFHSHAGAFDHELALPDESQRPEPIEPTSEPPWTLRLTRLLLRGVFSATWLPTPHRWWFHPSSMLHWLLCRCFGRLYVLRWAVLRLQRDFDRIEAMMDLIEESHGLSLHQQRDALLYFDPGFFSYLSRQFVTNCEILVDDFSQPRQKRRLQRQCTGTLKLARRTLDYHERFVATTAVLPYAVRIANTNAMTISLSRLARAMSLISRQTCEVCEAVPTRRRESLRFGYEALFHLSWQSRGHVGVQIGNHVGDHLLYTHGKFNHQFDDIIIANRLCRYLTEPAVDLLIVVVGRVSLVDRQVIGAAQCFTELEGAFNFGPQFVTNFFLE